jgi:hypothetical protein
MRNVSDKSWRGNKNTHFVFNNFFSPTILPCVRYCGKILYSRTGRRWQYGACALHAGYLSVHTHKHTHTHTVCNTYSFSTARMVARTRLSVTLYYVHFLLCLESVYPPPLPGKTEILPYCHRTVRRALLFEWLTALCDQFMDSVVYKVASDSVALFTELRLWLTEWMVKSVTFYDIPS